MTSHTFGSTAEHFAYDDVQQYGDAPVSDKGDGWAVFADYPRITWGQTRCGGARPPTPSTTWRQISPPASRRWRRARVRKWPCT